MVMSGKMKQSIYGLLQGSRAGICINGFMIHNNRKKILKYHCHYDHLKRYLVEKHSWESSTFNMVEWESLKRAQLATKAMARPGITKLMHGWQYNKYQQNKFSKGQMEHNTKCAMCEEDEDKGHDLVCRSRKMINARKAGWRILKQKMRPYTEQVILDKIWYGWHSITEDHEPDVGPLHEEEMRATRDAFESQTKIGWRQMFQGFISKDWGELNFKMMTSDTAQLDPISWTTKLIGEIFSLRLGLWNERNEAVHGNIWAISLEEKDYVIERTTELYNLVYPRVSEEDKWLFKKNVRHKTMEPTSMLVGWIDQVEARYGDLIKSAKLHTERRKQHEEYTRDMCRKGHNYLQYAGTHEGVQEE